MQARPTVGSHPGKRSGPGIEELHPGSTGIDLCLEVVADRIGDAVEECLEDLGLTEHQALGLRPVSRALAFDHVAGHGERRAGEPCMGVFVSARQGPNGLHRGREISDGIKVLQCGDVCCGTNRVSDDWTSAGNVVEVGPHALQRQEDVGEDDPRIEWVAPERLKRDLRSELWVVTHLQERTLTADGSILSGR